MPSTAIQAPIQNTLGNNSGFRPDIEFLRGIAVLLVIAFHLKISYFSSGYIGVDIFFVISGYLMAQALKDSPSSSIGIFYLRRARRILPAALFVFIVFFIISCIYFLPFETKKVAESFFGFLFLVPNIPFWLENSYFDEFSFRPMLHYWSLGIELQYYMVFPIIFFWFRRFLLLFLVMSLALSILLIEVSSKSAFFLLPPRIWEFLAGYYALQLQDKCKHIPLYIKNTISAISLITLVLYSTINIPQDRFPGFYAFAPAIFSFLVILFGSNNSIITSNISPIRFMGKISYSAYLVHFPIIFLFVYAPFSQWDSFSTSDAIFSFLLTVAIAAAMYFYIEEPFRKKSIISDKHFLMLTLTIAIACLISLTLLSHNQYYLKNYSSKEKTVFFSVNDQGTWRCHSIKSILDKQHKTCNMTNLESADHKLLLVGDSHIDAIKSIFLTQAKEYKTDVYLIKDSCVLGVDSCNFANLISLLKENNFSHVVLHGYLPKRFDFAQLTLFSQYASQHNISVYFIDPMPIYQESVPKIIYDEVTTGHVSPLRYNRTDYLENLDSEYIKFKEAEAQRIHFYSTADILCPNECLLEGDDGIYYHDSHHLSLIGASHLNSIASNIFSRLTND